MNRSRVLVSLRVGAPPERTCAAFTDEIGEWWRPNHRFRFTARRDTKLAFEPERETRSRCQSSWARYPAR